MGISRKQRGIVNARVGDAAERLGVDLVFATDRCHLIEDPWQDQAVPIRFHDEDASVAAILGAAAVNPIDGVLVVPVTSDDMFGTSSQ